MLALPILIQNHWFEFLVLVVDVLDEHDFIIGLESIIQLEATYYLASHILILSLNQFLCILIKTYKFYQKHLQ